MGDKPISVQRINRIVDSKYKNLFLYLAFLVAFLAVIANGFISSRFGNAVIDLGSTTIPASSISGCIQAVSVMACIFMVLIDYRAGVRLAIFTFLFSIFGITRNMIANNTLSSIPGAVNCLIYILVSIIIGKQLKMADRFALTDSSTGLPNRYGFERELETRLRGSERGYVAYLHIGGFHDLNANLGRKYGNSILMEVSQRIAGVVGDHGEVFKIEGAEFALILSEGCKYESLLSQVIDAIEEPIVVDKNGIKVNCFVTATAGVADFFDRRITTDEVMLCTDVAMNYAVNSRDEDCKISTYNDALRAEVAKTNEMEKMITDAIKNDNFYLQYQPQYILDGKRLRGFEALVRMRLNDGSTVSPTIFIPVAERSDLILEIDRYVRKRVMKEFKDICTAKGEGFVVSVNVSAKEISNPAFADEVLEAMEETGFPPECFEIEITEYSFVQSLDNTRQNIKELRDHGIKIAVDDFGTGYTSLSQLLNLPVTLLKIDKSLIDNLEDSEINRDFVKTVIYMGHLMNCEVISEGVEKESQLRLLNQFDCDFIQGFVWSRPLDYEVAVDLCK